jgi:hypothetical protein
VNNRRASAEPRHHLRLHERPNFGANDEKYHAGVAQRPPRDSITIVPKCGNLSKTAVIGINTFPRQRDILPAGTTLAKTPFKIKVIPITFRKAFPAIPTLRRDTRADGRENIATSVLLPGSLP